MIGCIHSPWSEGRFYLNNTLFVIDKQQINRMKDEEHMQRNDPLVRKLKNQIPVAGEHKPTCLTYQRGAQLCIGRDGCPAGGIADQHTIFIDMCPIYNFRIQIHATFIPNKEKFLYGWCFTKEYGNINEL
jgi:hypothetical protein